MVPSPLDLSQRDGAFWVGLALFLAGAELTSGVTTRAMTPTDQLGLALLTLGGLLLVLRTVVAVGRIFRTTVLAGRLGYEEGTEESASRTDSAAGDDERSTLSE